MRNAIAIDTTKSLDLSAKIVSEVSGLRDLLGLMLQHGAEAAKHATGNVVQLIHDSGMVLGVLSLDAAHRIPSQSAEDKKEDQEGSQEDCHLRP